MIDSGVQELLSKLHDRLFVILHIGLTLAAIAVAVANLFLSYEVAGTVTLACVVFVIFPYLIYWMTRCGFCAVRQYRLGTLKGREESLAYAVNCVLLSFFAAAIAFHLLTRGFVMPAFRGD